MKKLYSDSYTSVNINGYKTGRIKCYKGLKQGDPLSPMLFNISIDPFIYLIEKNLK